jgi:tRNA threonylcarbamoyladenosine biosynthesis protein TsaB
LAKNLILVIDTSGTKLQLALGNAEYIDVLSEDIIVRGKKELGNKKRLNNKKRLGNKKRFGHAEILFDRIDKLFERNAVTYKDLTKIGVTTGPGSFTGLRVGLSAAKSLALALEIEIVGVNNLIALSLAKLENNFSIMLDARRDEVFVQSFFRAGMSKEKPLLLSLDDDFLSFGGLNICEPQIDMKLLAKFALKAKPDEYLADPCYIRKADAKISTKGIIK